MIAQFVINDYRTLGIKAEPISYDYKNPPVLKEGSYIIAVRCIKTKKASKNEDNDYHFMRLHSNGMWSDKHGTLGSVLHRFKKNPDSIWWSRYKSKTIYILVGA